MNLLTEKKQPSKTDFDVRLQENKFKILPL